MQFGWCAVQDGMMISVLLMLSVISGAHARGRQNVRIDFSDSVTVEDTAFTIGAIATVTCNDPKFKAEIENTVAGTSAPPSFGRFLAVGDFRVRNLALRYPDVSFECTGTQRPFIKTAFKVVRIADFKDLIEKAVCTSVDWNSGTYVYSIDNISDSLSVMKKKFISRIQGIERPFYPKGKVNLTLILEQGGKTFRIPVRCTFTVSIPVKVASRDIVRGAILSHDDYETKTIDITHFTPTPICHDSMLTGKKALRSIRKGTILHNRLVSEPPLIEKGDQVSIISKYRGFSISISGMARESGTAGEKIWVENGATQKLVHVRIIDRGIVAAVSGGKKP